MYNQKLFFLLCSKFELHLHEIKGNNYRYIVQVHYACIKNVPCISSSLSIKEFYGFMGFTHKITRLAISLQLSHCFKSEFFFFYNLKKVSRNSVCLKIHTFIHQNLFVGVWSFQNKKKKLHLGTN